VDTDKSPSTRHCGIVPPRRLTRYIYVLIFHETHFEVVKMLSLKKVATDNPALIELVGLLDADLNENYGNLQLRYNQYNSLATVDGAIVAFLDGSPIGCGCFRKLDASKVEIKRMFVRAENRGSGAANGILVELEWWAQQLGFSTAVLETGIKQLAAIRFYEKSGYSRIENYGQYAGMDTSICMGKNLSS
jgi:GNAT superfamily N-acetyltransferase